jgi:hypothetical protein
MTAFSLLEYFNAIPGANNIPGNSTTLLAEGMTRPLMVVKKTGC